METNGAGDKIKIAALACCYNRLSKTTSFLKSLLAQAIPDGYQLDIFLLDDQSTDGTGAYVREHFPTVQVMEGSGSLFWAGGMRALWKKVMAGCEYDFYLLLNDDVTLFDNVLINLLNAYEKVGAPENVLVGTVKNFDQTIITYGGRKLFHPYKGNSYLVEPHMDELLPCDLGNANVMLVDKGAVAKIGILSDPYVHSLADYDYTMKAVRNGVKVWVAPGFYGYCENDHGKPWLSGNKSLKQRISYLYSPKGLEYKQYMYYIKTFFPVEYMREFIKLWTKTLLPVMYDKFKKD